MIKNDRIWKWFDNEKIEDALLGREEYFIPDVTFRDQHDILLVVDQLLQWAQCGRMKEAASSFQHAIEQNELFSSLKLYQTYLVEIEEGKERLDLDEVNLRQTLVTKIKEQGHYISENKTLRSAIINFLNKFPELKRQVGL